MLYNLDKGGVVRLFYKVYVVFISGIFLFTSIQIIGGQIKRKRRKDKEIIKFNRNFNNLMFGFIWFVLFIIWSALFIIKIHDVYAALNKDYIGSVFQLFNIEYLESLRKEFYENSMLSQLNTVAFYQSKLFLYLTWIICSFCIAILNFYMGWQHNVIYKNGILYGGKIFEWNRIIDYKWHGSYERKLFGRGKYYDLVITLQKRKLFNLGSKVKIQVNCEDRNAVNEIIEGYLNKGNV